MAGNGNSQSQLPAFFGPGLIVILGGLIAYFTFEPALESLRPELPQTAQVPPPPSPRHLNALHSRLWDDPLTAAYQDFQKRPPERMNAWQQFLSNVIRRGRAESDVQHYFRALSESCLNCPNGTKGSFLCLPVLIRGGPYDGDTEQRKRTTYAVLAALATCGYELSYPDRLSYVELPVTVDMCDVGERIEIQMVVPAKAFRRAKVTSAELPIPAGPEGVLLLWINEDQLGDQPLAVIGQVLDGVYGSLSQRDNIEVAILGPTNSGTLLAMAQEAASCRQSGCAKQLPIVYDPNDGGAFTLYYSGWKRTVLYSGRAAIPEDVLDVMSENDSCEAAAAFEAFIEHGLPERGLPERGLKVVSTIGSDEQLVRSLAGELFLRGAWPLEADPATAPDSAPLKPKKHIVLVAESDTPYGTAITKVFRRAFPQLVTDLRHDDAADCNLLHVFTYLRGVDGKNPEAKSASTQANEEKNKAESAESNPFRSRNLEKVAANGCSQLDYLRRLEQQLIECDARIRTKGNNGIVAIGIVATDVYDKLLLLRSLRPHFPQALFFTTDLDDELTASTEFPDNHNLLVASHFGLTLNPALQRTVLPFRDTYQTATFFSALQALNDEALMRKLPAGIEGDVWGRKTESPTHGPLGRHLQPLLFEIARSGAYQLTIPEKDGPLSALIHPAGPRQRHWLTYPFNIAMAVLAAVLFLFVWLTLSTTTDKVPLAVFYFWPPTRWRRDRAVNLGAFLVVVGTLCFLLHSAANDHTRRDGEPFVFFDGISIWPATILRFLAAALSVVCLVKAQRDTRSAFRDKLDNLCLSIATGPSKSCAEAYEEYKSFSGSWLSLAYPLLPTALAIAFGCCIFSITQSPMFPYRGETSRLWSQMTLVLAIGSIMYLIFFVVLRLKTCSQFISKIVRQAPDWSSGGMQELARERLAPENNGERDVPREVRAAQENDLREVLTIDIIAEATQFVGRTIKYPILAVLLMIVSRHQIFSSANLNLTASLVVTWSFMFVVLFAGAWRLRRTANDARDKVLGRLRCRHTQAIDAGEAGQTRATLLGQYISEIEQENRGAFQFWLQDPLVSAVTVLLGGAGGIQILGYLFPYF